MKKIILLAFVILMVVGCSIKTKENGEPIISDYYNQHSVDNPYLQVLDSCEYICWRNRLAHKGNCRFCAERRKQELDSLVKQLKGSNYDN